MGYGSLGGVSGKVESLFSLGEPCVPGGWVFLLSKLRWTFPFRGFSDALFGELSLFGGWL